MKILQVNTLFAPRLYGGAEVFLKRFSESLVARGHQVLVACLSPDPKQHGDDQLRVHELELKNLYWPFDGARYGRVLKAAWHLRNSFGCGGAAQLGALLECEKPDLVHTHNLSGLTTAVWPTTCAHGVPLVHTIHDYALLCPSATMFRKDANCATQCLGCRVLSRLHRHRSGSVDTVVGVSSFALDQHTRSGFFSRARQHVIHNGNPHTDLSEADQPRSLPETPRIGYLGRLAPSKGIELMLDALAPLVPQRCHVQVAGSGTAGYERELKSRCEPRGVRFVGRVDASRFLSTIDVLVVPSLWHEPFGLVLCEAMDAGVPVVASAVGGIPEIVAHGQSGFLFQRGNGEELRDHVIRLIEDRELYCRMSHCCRERAETHSFDRMVDSYLRVYEQLSCPSSYDVELVCHN
jgi:glycosyltransferase involved in cell wall biosynthesis